MAQPHGRRGPTQGHDERGGSATVLGRAAGPLVGTYEGQVCWTLACRSQAGPPGSLFVGYHLWTMPTRRMVSAGEPLEGGLAYLHQS